MKCRFTQTCSAAAEGSSVYSCAPSYADSLPEADAAEAASALFALPVLLSALPVSVPVRGEAAGANTVD